jgi:hypothetical protein
VKVMKILNLIREFEMQKIKGVWRKWTSERYKSPKSN